MYCSSCGTQNDASGKFCIACGLRLVVADNSDFNARQLKEARARLDSQEWPAYGFVGSIAVGFASFFIFDEGLVWGGWAPDWIYQWLIFACFWAFVLGLAYGIGFLIDDSKLQNIKEGETVHLTSWRIILCTAAGLVFGYWQLDNPGFFFQ